MKENRLENLLWLIFLGVGLIFIVVGIVIGANYFNLKDKGETIATITDISTYRGSGGSRQYDVMVKYKVDGKTYASLLNSYSSNFYNGKEIEIYYDKEYPNKILLKSSNVLILVFPGIGLVFSIIGTIGITYNRNKNKLEKKLKRTGTLIYADYVEAIYNRSYSVNGIHPYNIICEWLDTSTNKKYIFRSKNIWINPENTIKEQDIKAFPVYINLENKKQYTVDVDFLTENVIDLR